MPCVILSFTNIPALPSQKCSVAPLFIDGLHIYKLQKSGRNLQRENTTPVTKRQTTHAHMRSSFQAHPSKASIVYTGSITAQLKNYFLTAKGEVSGKRWESRILVDSMVLVSPFFLSRWHVFFLLLFINLDFSWSKVCFLSSFYNLTCLWSKACFLSFVLKTILL